MTLKRLVIDVLKPHQPTIAELARNVSNVHGVGGVNVSLIEVDEDVKNVKVTIEGDFEEQHVRDVIEESSGSIHSIDEVVAGEKMVEKVDTPQD